MTRELAELDSPREDLHLLAREVLGPAALSAMYEGLAVALEQDEEESNLGMYAAALEEQDRVPSIAEMLDEERLRVLVREGVGRPAAGLLVRWIRANADDATFRRAYTLREGGTGALASLLGMEAAAMEKSFAAWLGAQAEASRDDYRYTKMLTDARKLGAAGDRAAEQAALRKALEVRPDDPETLYLISLSQLRGSDFAGAEKTLSRLLEATADRKETTVHVLAVYRMGQALDRLGRTDEALDRFESLLGLPDRDDSHRLARKAIEKIERRKESGD
jgi:tetratricopeptide (TPR) repeat protein